MWLRALSVGAVFAFGIACSPIANAATAPEHCEWRPDAGDRAKTVYLACAGTDGTWARINSTNGLTVETVGEAEIGHGNAMATLGMFYIDGPVEARNIPLGISWLKKAIDAHYAPAFADLGYLYRFGDGMPGDMSEAVRWFRAGAEAGDSRSQVALGVAYFEGNGITQDYLQSRRWIATAASAGYPSGEFSLGWFDIHSPQSAAGPDEAVKSLKNAATHRSVQSMRELAILAEKGLGMPHSSEAAVGWRKRADEADRWTALPSGDDVSGAYPVDAAAANIVGHAQLGCFTSLAGHLQNCHVVTEEPLGYGFGEAARTLISKYEKSGLASDQYQTLNFTFKLSGVDVPRKMADDCTAYALALLAAGPLVPPIRDWTARYYIASSRRYSLKAGEQDFLNRLAPAVAEAKTRLAEGKEKGFLGMLFRCRLG